MSWANNLAVLKSLVGMGKKKGSNVTIIPTVVTNDGSMWVSDVRVRPDDVPDDQKVVFVRKDTVIGTWICPETGYYPWKLIRGYKGGE